MNPGTDEASGVFQPGHRFRSDVPGRLDRLPWSRWHWRVVLALGITWLLDGLEVTLVGAIAPTLTLPQTLGLSTSQAANTATAYLVGAVLGALAFGRLTDRYGRRRLFFVTVAVYLGATAASAFAQGFASLVLFRFLTEERKLDQAATAEKLWRDYQRGGRRDRPQFLREHLPDDGQIAERPKARPSLSLKRQVRHLGLAKPAEAYSREVAENVAADVRRRIS